MRLLTRCLGRPWQVPADLIISPLYIVLAIILLFSALFVIRNSIQTLLFVLCILSLFYIRFWYTWYVSLGPFWSRWGYACGHSMKSTNEYIVAIFGLAQSYAVKLPVWWKSVIMMNTIIIMVVGMVLDHPCCRVSGGQIRLFYPSLSLIQFQSRLFIIFATTSSAISKYALPLVASSIIVWTFRC